MLFSGAGHSVSLFDVSRDLIDKAIADMEKQFLTLETSGLLRGSLTTVQRLALIAGKFCCFSIFQTLLTKNALLQVPVLSKSAWKTPPLLLSVFLKDWI